jgi:hypothetical protein
MLSQNNVHCRRNLKLLHKEALCVVRLERRSLPLRLTSTTFLKEEEHMQKHEGTEYATLERKPD